MESFYSMASLHVLVACGFMGVYRTHAEAEHFYDTVCRPANDAENAEWYRRRCANPDNGPREPPWPTPSLAECDCIRVVLDAGLVAANRDKPDPSCSAADVNGVVPDRVFVVYEWGWPTTGVFSTHDAAKVAFGEITACHYNCAEKQKTNCQPIICAIDGVKGGLMCDEYEPPESTHNIELYQMYFVPIVVGAPPVKYEG